MKIIDNLIIIVFLILFNDITYGQLKNIESTIIDEDNHLISLPKNFEPINENLIFISDMGSGEGFFINTNGKILKSISPPLKYVDSIASNCIPASVFMSDYMRFLHIEEVTVPPGRENSGKTFPLDKIKSFISRKYEYCEIIDKNTVVLAAKYDMFVQEMDPNSDIFNRGGEYHTILHFIDLNTYEIISSKHIQYNDEVYPRAINITYDNKKNHLFLFCDDKIIENNQVSFLAKSEIDEFDYYEAYYYPDEVAQYPELYKSNTPNVLLHKGFTYCAFKFHDKIYNLTTNTHFVIEGLKCNNNYFLSKYTFDTPYLDSIKFVILDFISLHNDNLLLIGKIRDDKNWKYFLQEYTQQGELLKQEYIADEINAGLISQLKGLNGTDKIFGLVYDEKTENRKLITIRW